MSRVKEELGVWRKGWMKTGDSGKRKGREKSERYNKREGNPRAQIYEGNSNL